MPPVTAIKEFPLHPPKAFVGFSGGADSTALLLAMQLCGIPVTAVHFNHHLRGADADADAQWCREFCEARNIPFIAVDLQVNQERLPGESLETAARRLRLREWHNLTRDGGTPVFLAHHLDDCLEELFLRLARGANCSGLTGMKPMRRMADGTLLCRPLLKCRKSELEEFLRENGVEEWRIDATNAISDCRRNAVRNRLLPLFREIFQNDSGLIAAMETLREDAEFIEQHVPDETDVCDLQDLPRPVLVRALRSALPLPMPPSRQAVLRLEEAINNYRLGEKVLVPIGGGLLVKISGGPLKLVSRKELDEKANRPPPEPVKFYWKKNKAQECDDGRCAIVRLQKKDLRKSLKYEAFDPDSLPEYLTIDFWRPGDRMRTFGGHTKKLQDLFQEKHIPKEARKFFPVVKAGNEIIWVPGVCRSPFGKVKQGGKFIRFGFMITDD